MRVRFCWVILFSLFSFSVSSQNWKIISGKYATVEYNERLESTADSLLKIAELAIPRISEMIEVPLSSYDETKTRIILTDAPDISNGFALANVVTIYATSSQYIPFWTGVTNWYQQVLTHELVHHVTFRKTKRKASILGEVSNTTVPRWFWEGTAQYYSETWNTYRGDIFIKNAVLNGQLNYNSIAFGNDGRLLYAGGHAFVRWLASEYGDSSLVKLMAHEPEEWLYDFDGAFKDVYGISVPEMFQKFLRKMILYYGDRFADYPISTSFKELKKFGFTDDQFITLSTTDSTYLISTQQNPIHFYRTASVVKIENGKAKTIKNLTNNYATSLVVSPDQNWIAWGRNHLEIEDNQSAMTFDWFVYNMTTSETKKVAENLRSRYGVFNQNNELILANITHSESDLIKYDLNGKSELIYSTKMPVGTLNCSPSNTIYFDAQRPNGNRDIFALSSTGEISDLTNDSVDDRFPIFVNDSTLIFNRYEKENPAIAFYHLHAKTFTIVSDDQYEHFLTDYDRKSNQLILTGWDPLRRSILYSISPDSLIRLDSKPQQFSPNSSYAKWTQKFPDSGNLIHLPDTEIVISDRKKLLIPQNNMVHFFSFVIPDFDNDYGFGINGSTNWADPLQRQIFSATASIYFDHPEKSLAYFAHYLMAADLQFSTFWFHGPAIFSFDRNDHHTLWRDIFTFDISKIFFVDYNPRFYYRLGVNYSGYRTEQIQIDPALPTITGYHGPTLKGSVGYNLPTKYSSFLPKRSFEISGQFFQSLDDKYDFSVSELNFDGGINLISERVGLKTSFSLISHTGILDSLQVLGIDRFYQIAIPRDINFTRTVRGVREDINGKNLQWSSSEIQILLAEQTGMKFFIFPIDNLVFSAFFDFAQVSGISEKTVWGVGGELSSGINGLRYGVGYAYGKRSSGSKEESVYARIRLELPGM